MQSIVLRIDPSQLHGLDADLRYTIPSLLFEATAGGVQDDGYDYEEGSDAMLIYLSTENSEAALPFVVNLIQSENFQGTGLAAATQIGVSNLPAAKAASFQVMFPEELKESVLHVRSK
jgi:hypothetical protein